MSWSSSRRRDRLPTDWPARVARVKARAKGKCQAREHVRGCSGIGTDCDHIRRGDDHSLDNLQWLSGPCHVAKTAAENIADREAWAAMRVRPAEGHPGAIKSNR